MTSNQTRSQGKTRDRHSAEPVRRSSRPATQDTASSADEIRETVKEAVGKGVSAVAGAVEGLDETLTETQLADTAESAVRQVGEMATNVVRTAKEETQNLKEALRGEGGTSGGASETEDDLETERGDPTFGTGVADFGRADELRKRKDLGLTEANTSGESLEPEGLHGSSYNEGEEPPSQGI